MTSSGKQDAHSRRNVKPACRKETAEQRALTKRLVAREHDRVLRIWMPYDAGFSVWQPHLRNIGGLDMRTNFGYGSSTLARLWLDK